ncbi:MAG: KaiC domain-containing protein, partial [Desulfurococcales archaeon]|nr:KaiC domain-containing protein [Desulfurococcales archaeon]
MERVKTGIPGLDELLYGGIPKRNVVLVSGGPGTGKTIMSQQYIFNGLK